MFTTITLHYADKFGLEWSQKLKKNKGNLKLNTKLQSRADCTSLHLRSKQSGSNTRTNCRAASNNTNSCPICFYKIFQLQTNHILVVETLSERLIVGTGQCARVKWCALSESIENFAINILICLLRATFILRTIPDKPAAIWRWHRFTTRKCW